MNSNLPRTPRYQKVLALAEKEALAGGQNYVGTEHLVLGLLSEAEGAIVTMFQHAGLDLSIFTAKMRAAALAISPVTRPINPLKCDICSKLASKTLTTIKQGTIKNRDFCPDCWNVIGDMFASEP